jgi:hypothetical protein
METSEPQPNRYARRAQAAEHIRKAFKLLMDLDHVPEADVVIAETMAIMAEAIAAPVPSRRSEPMRPTDTRICLDCGDMFEITVGNREFYGGRGLQLPRRCEVCRRARRQQGAES